MAVIKQTIKNLVGGVSQQTPQMRRENQCSDQLNCWNDVVKGMRKRPQTRLVKSLALPSTMKEPSYFIHSISDSERYLIVATETSLNVYDVTTGEEVALDAPNVAYLKGGKRFGMMTIGDDVMLLNAEVNTAMRPLVPQSTTGRASRRWEFKQASGLSKNGYSIYIKGKEVKGFGSAHSVFGQADKWNRPVDDAIKFAAELKKAYPTEMVRRIGHFVTWSGESTTVINVASTQPQWLDLITKGLSSIKDPLTTGLAYIVQPDYNVKYKLIFNVDGTQKVIEHKTPSATSSGARDKVNTDAILEVLKKAIEDDDTLDFAVRLYGNNCLLVEPASSNVKKWSLRADDSLNGKSFVAFRNTLRAEGDLPPDAPEGYYVEITNKSGEDSYHLVYSASETGDGYWKETVKPNIPTELDESTMPHILRRVFDANGKPKFIFEAYEWEERKVGDADTAPEPSFVGNKISAMSLMQGRLVFVSGNDISMSEVNADNNFWATTAVTLVDSDPIDLSLDTPESLDVRDITNDNEVLILWDNNVQMGLQFDGVNWTANEVSAYNVDTLVSPVRIGSMFYYSGVGASRTQIGAYYRVRDQLYESMDTTAHVPTYLKTRPKFITGNSVDSYVAVCDGNSPDVYIYNYRQQGQDMVQAAWSKWTVGQKVLFMHDTNGTLYLLVERFGKIYLEAIDLQSQSAVMMDALEVSDKKLAATDGKKVVKYKGNWYRGWHYTQQYVFSPIYPRVDEVALMDAKLMLRKLELHYENTVGFNLKAERFPIYLTKDLRMIQGLPSLLNGDVEHKRGTFGMVIRGDATDYKITLTNNEPYECNIASFTWMGSYHKRTR